MDFKDREIDLVGSEEGANPCADIQELIARIKEIEPVEMAEALCLLESQKNLSELNCYAPSQWEDQSRLYFSRGLKTEVEEIYLELARHLREKTDGSLDLMNTVFDFLSDTLRSLVHIPHLNSPN